MCVKISIFQKYAGKETPHFTAWLMGYFPLFCYLLRLSPSWNIYFILRWCQEGILISTQGLNWPAEFCKEQLNRPSVTGWIENFKGNGSMKGFLQEASAKIIWELLMLNRNLLRQVTTLLTDIAIQRQLANNPVSDRWHHKEETAAHILCDCQVLN